MCDSSARMHCLAERRSKIGQTVTGKYENAMRVSNSIAAATARPTFIRFITLEARAPNLRQTLPKALHRSSPLTITSNRYSALWSDDDQAVDKDSSDKNEKTKSTSHHSRPRQRSASREPSASHSRGRSASFPPLEESKKVSCNTTGGSGGNSNSQGQKQPEKTSSSSSSSSQKADKQVCWAARISHIDAWERELLECKTMNEKLLETIAQMQKVMSEMAEKKIPRLNSPPHTTPSAPQQR
ncbi:hypothetical protein HPB50_018311 [Hyalomma asiaticum]|uniref:Uncharacterized protein n=1 Tax=Hyalomma asiaticum TaxID=266040 RepID=A0ACB7RRH7_HYAAI|nr:hypothetical protein HPB50_018311 [Hyalomma asiaticum]